MPDKGEAPDAYQECLARRRGPHESTPACTPAAPRARLLPRTRWLAHWAASAVAAAVGVASLVEMRTARPRSVSTVNGVTTIRPGEDHAEVYELAGWGFLVASALALWAFLMWAADRPACLRRYTRLGVYTKLALVYLADLLSIWAAAAIGLSIQHADPGEELAWATGAILAYGLAGGVVLGALALAVRIGTEDARVRQSEEIRRHNLFLRERDRLLARREAERDIARND